MKQIVIFLKKQLLKQIMSLDIYFGERTHYKQKSSFLCIKVSKYLYAFIKSTNERTLNML